MTYFASVHTLMVRATTLAIDHHFRQASHLIREENLCMLIANITMGADKIMKVNSLDLQTL